MSPPQVRSSQDEEILQPKAPEVTVQASSSASKGENELERNIKAATSEDSHEQPSEEKAIGPSDGAMKQDEPYQGRKSSEEIENPSQRSGNMAGSAQVGSKGQDMLYDESKSNSARPEKNEAPHGLSGGEEGSKESDKTVESATKDMAEATLSEKRGLSPTLSEKPLVASPSPPPPPPKDEKYVADEYNEKYDMDQGDQYAGVVDDSRSEIQSIMEQFDDGMPAPGAEEIMSPRMEFAGPMLGSPVHPPRKSSLEPINSGALIDFNTEHSVPTLKSPPPRTSSLPGTSNALNEKSSSAEKNMSPKPSNSIFKPPPPDPDPEPDLPFDFHRFLGQLRDRTADPVAKFLRSFLVEFGKKQWMVHEQVKIIGDFLEFISKKMGQCEIWRTVSDAEFDNAREGMEKLVMNRLYTQTFSPAIPPPEPTPGGSRKRKAPQSPTTPGRRGQHQEDVERDEVLAQKVRIYKWIREEHLDIKPVGDKGRKFLHLAQQGWIYATF
jgi:Rab5 GDP/GTP exchange factor